MYSPGRDRAGEPERNRLNRIRAPERVTVGSLVFALELAFQFLKRDLVELAGRRRDCKLEGLATVTQINRAFERDVCAPIAKLVCNLLFERVESLLRLVDVHVAHVRQHPLRKGELDIRREEPNRTEHA